MNKPTTTRVQPAVPLRTSLLHAVPVLAALTGALVLLAGCGGGMDSASDNDTFSLSSTSVTTLALPASETAAPKTVPLEGCVVDSHWQSVPGAAVHARTADGRAVGTAFTDAHGVFVLAVPARSALELSTDWGGPMALALNTGSQGVSVAACLPSDL
jgi:hypothetical protein